MNVFAYRLPGNEESCSIAEYSDPRIGFRSMGQKYFIVHPFLPSTPFYSFPFIRTLAKIPEEIVMLNADSQPHAGTCRKEYIDYVEQVKNAICQGEVLKVVTSRRQLVHARIQPQQLFDKLCEKYPDAFVFFISSPLFGSWIGASPELLLKKEGTEISTMALAGTRVRGSDSEWDAKNLKEQEIVVDFISDTFRKSSLTPLIGTRNTIIAGPVEHLMTPIKARCERSDDLSVLVSRLSPTPALCGTPVEKALRLIESHETIPRQLYGGFIGPVDKNGDFRFNVVLRCAKLWPSAAMLYAGGGITALSDPEEEWIETNRKLSTLKF